MKTTISPFNTAATLGVLIFAGIAANSVAIEAPADNAPPVPVADQGDKKADRQLPQFKLDEAQQPAAKVEPAFLGVVSGEIPEMLAYHLDLAPGQGVIIRSLVPQGPAASAGLSLNDIVTGVAGKAVSSPQELSDRISEYKPGEKITLDLIQKGKPTKLDVALGARPAEMAAWGQQLLDPQLGLEGLPKELADRIREALAGNIGRLDLQLGQRNGLIEDAMRDLQLRMQGALDGDLPIPDGAQAGQVHGEAKVQLRDAAGSVEVVSKNGGKEVTVRDLDGNITWSGPWDTAQDKAAAPDTVRQRVDSLNLDADFKGQGLRFNMKRPAAPDAE
jgi:serine protease Do